MKSLKISMSIVLALSIVLLVTIWMASGLLSHGPAAAVTDSETTPKRMMMTIQAARLESSPIARVVAVQGELEPVKTATLRAEASGQVEKILAERGDMVRKGQVIVQLRMNDREARLKQAEALVRQRETEFKAKAELVREGFIERIAEKEAMSVLESALAALETIRLEIEHTRIRAPFDGILENRGVEAGDILAVNDEVGLLVDTSTLIAAGRVPQQEIQHIRPGRRGTVRLITGQSAQGRVRYVASMSDKATQTFRIELEVENSEQSLPSGVSAEILLPLDMVEAHFLSPAALVLDQSGTVGVKTVDQEGRVGFRTVKTVQAQNDGIWVSGLDRAVSVIISGQGFVSPGEQVNVVYSESGAPTAALAQ
jgi:membrane fusion protein, multidrug efflux system